MARRDDIDFGRSRAILLGTSGTRPVSGTGAPCRRAQRASRDAKVLTGPCEWPKARISELPNQKDSGRLLRTITALIRDVDDVLLFYYVGHGLPLPESGRYDLGLALTDTNDDPAHRALTSLRLRDLREQIVHHSTARIKVLILDCCSSGIATKYGESAANLTAYAVSATPVRGAGIYVWASCGHSQETYFEEKKGGLTYFTKYLSEAVREAHGEQSAGATVAHLHDEVRRRMRAQHPERPVPAAARPALQRPPRPVPLRPRQRARPARPHLPAWQAGGRRSAQGRAVRVEASLGAGGIGRVFLAFTHGGHAIAVRRRHRGELSAGPSGGVARAGTAHAALSARRRDRPAGRSGHRPARRRPQPPASRSTPGRRTRRKRSPAAPAPGRGVAHDQPSGAGSAAAAGRCSRASRRSRSKPARGLWTRPHVTSPSLRSRSAPFGVPGVWLARRGSTKRLTARCAAAPRRQAPARRLRGAHDLRLRRTGVWLAKGARPNA